MTHTITIRPATDERPGWTEVNLAVDGQAQVSNCGILALEMRIGAAVVRMDGIGGVSTLEPYRNQGHARHVLNAAIAHMSAGDAALTMLYGITDFYPKFGYATAGPDYLLELPLPQETVTVTVS
jgi:predicted acetyltransferase